MTPYYATTWDLTPWGKRARKDPCWPTRAALENSYQPRAGCPRVPKGLQEARAAGPVKDRRFLAGCSPEPDDLAQTTE